MCTNVTKLRHVFLISTSEPHGEQRWMGHSRDLLLITIRSPYADEQIPECTPAAATQSLALIASSEHSKPQANDKIVHLAGLQELAIVRRMSNKAQFVGVAELAGDSLYYDAMSDAPFP
jgi:hypothetical protein